MSSLDKLQSGKLLLLEVNLDKCCDLQLLFSLHSGMNSLFFLVKLNKSFSWLTFDILPDFCNLIVGFIL